MKPNEAKLYLKMSRLATLIKDGDMSEELKEKLLKDLYGIRDEYVEQTKSKSVFVLEETYEDLSTLEFTSKATVFADADVAMAYYNAKVELEKQYYIEKGYTEKELENSGFIYANEALIQTDEYVSTFDLYQTEPATMLDVMREIDTMKKEAENLREENENSLDDDLDR